MVGLDYRILVQNPLVLVPRNGTSQDEFIQLDLGRIYVYTTPVPAQGSSLLSLEVEDFNVRTMLPGLVQPLPLLKNTALLLRLVQSLGSVQTVDPTVRSFTVMDSLMLNVVGTERSAITALQRIRSPIGLTVARLQ